MNIAIVGCGLIGRRRLKALRQDDRLVIAADNVLSRAEELASGNADARVTDDWRFAVTHPDVEAVIVSTTNDWLMPVTLCAVSAGKHVLVEKPAARCAHELQKVLVAVQRNPVCVWVGFNHRYHPAFQEARKIVDSGAAGRLMFVRGRYGHGGRKGYEQEWRAQPEISGGGELLDQGVHLIDLASWFLGDFTRISGFVNTYFWDMPVEDNAFLFLRTASDQVAWLHASCTEWRNLFSFEIYGQKAKLQIDGLGGSYGLERLTYHKVMREMGAPSTTVLEFPGNDLSWHKEYEAFMDLIESGILTTQPLDNALATLEIVDSVYRQSQSELKLKNIAVNSSRL